MSRISRTAQFISLVLRDTAAEGRRGGTRRGLNSHIGRDRDGATPLTLSEHKNEQRLGSSNTRDAPILFERDMGAAARITR